MSTEERIAVWQRQRALVAAAMLRSPREAEKDRPREKGHNDNRREHAGRHCR